MATKRNSNVKSPDVTPVGLLEIDRTVYNWFDSRHATIIQGRKVPVLFGSWERWAQIQGNKEDDNLNSLRDHKGMVKLPMISIVRGDAAYSEQRSIRQDNRGSSNISIIKKIADSNFDSNQRIPFRDRRIVEKDGVKKWYKNEPVYEIQSIPYPEFIDITYTINFWSSYISHVNKFHEMVWQEVFPGDFEYQGHRFHATIKTQSDQSNIDNFTDEERIIRHTFNLELQAYLIPKGKIEFHRTSTEIKMDESVLSAEDFDEDFNTNISIDHLIQAGEKKFEK